MKPSTTASFAAMLALLLAEKSLAGPVHASIEQLDIQVDIDHPAPVIPNSSSKRYERYETFVKRTELAEQDQPVQNRLLVAEKLIVPDDTEDTEVYEAFLRRTGARADKRLEEQARRRAERREKRIKEKQREGDDCESDEEVKEVVYFIERRAPRGGGGAAAGASRSGNGSKGKSCSIM